MYELHGGSLGSGTERSNEVFAWGLSRSVPFRSVPLHFTAQFSEPSTFEVERSASRRSRVNTCKILLLSRTVPYRFISFRFRVNEA